jgi:hypothetical protein
MNHDLKIKHLSVLGANARSFAADLAVAVANCHRQGTYLHFIRHSSKRSRTEYPLAVLDADVVLSGFPSLFTALQVLPHFDGPDDAFPNSTTQPDKSVASPLSEEGKLGVGTFSIRAIVDSDIRYMLPRGTASELKRANLKATNTLRSHGARLQRMLSSPDMFVQHFRDSEVFHGSDLGKATFLRLLSTFVAAWDDNILYDQFSKKASRLPDELDPYTKELRLSAETYCFDCLSVSRENKELNRADAANFGDLCAVFQSPYTGCSGIPTLISQTKPLLNMREQLLHAKGQPFTGVFRAGKGSGDQPMPMLLENMLFFHVFYGLWLYTEGNTARFLEFTSRMTSDLARMQRQILTLCQSGARDVYWEEFAAFDENWSDILLPNFFSERSDTQFWLDDIARLTYWRQVTYGDPQQSNLKVNSHQQFAALKIIQDIRSRAEPGNAFWELVKGQSIRLPGESSKDLKLSICALLSYFSGGEFADFRGLILDDRSGDNAYREAPGVAVLPRFGLSSRTTRPLFWVNFIPAQSDAAAEAFEFSVEHWLPHCDLWGRLVPILQELSKLDAFRNCEIEVRGISISSQSMIDTDCTSCEELSLTFSSPKDLENELTGLVNGKVFDHSWILFCSTIEVVVATLVWRLDFADAGSQCTKATCSVDRDLCSRGLISVLSEALSQFGPFTVDVEAVKESIERILAAQRVLMIQ